MKYLEILLLVGIFKLSSTTADKESSLDYSIKRQSVPFQPRLNSETVENVIASENPIRYGQETLHIKKIKTSLSNGIIQSYKSNSLSAINFKCPDSSNNNYPVPNDCRSYFKCERGVSKKKECGVFQLFDAYKNQCLFFIYAECYQSITTAAPGGSSQTPTVVTTPTPPTPIKCDINQSYNYPDFNDCKMYYQCSHGNVFHRKCPMFRYFDGITRNCMIWGAVCQVQMNSDVPKRMIDTESTGGTRKNGRNLGLSLDGYGSDDEEEERQHLDLYRQESLQDIHFNSKVSSNEDTMIYPRRKILSIDSFRIDPTCKPGQYFKKRYKPNCRKYYSCVDGELTLESCLYFFYFDAIMSECRLSFLVDCSIDGPDITTTTQSVVTTTTTEMSQTPGSTTSEWTTETSSETDSSSYSPTRSTDSEKFSILKSTTDYTSTSDSSSSEPSTSSEDFSSTTETFSSTTDTEETSLPSSTTDISSTSEPSTTSEDVSSTTETISSTADTEETSLPSSTTDISSTSEHSTTSEDFSSTTETFSSTTDTEETSLPSSTTDISSTSEPSTTSEDVSSTTETISSTADTEETSLPSSTTDISSTSEHSTTSEDFSSTTETFSSTTDTEETSLPSSTTDISSTSEPSTTSEDVSSTTETISSTADTEETSLPSSTTDISSTSEPSTTSEDFSSTTETFSTDMEGTSY